MGKKMANTQDYYTKEQRKAYNRDYKQMGKKYGMPQKLVYVPIQIDSSKLKPLSGSEVCCATFGCPSKLTPMEVLYGNICFKCIGNIPKKPDPTDFNRKL